MKAWLDRVLNLEEINGRGICPTYLYRWTLFRCGSLFSIYLHKFVGDDWSLDYHDHPKRFWSIGLKGWYTEWTPCFLVAHPAAYHLKTWRAPWFRTFPADHIHRLTGPTAESPCWTLVIVGTAVREWGFWPLGAWVPWRRYVNSDTAEARKACP